MRVKLTSRGIKLLLASAMVLALGLVLNDAVMVTSALLTWVYVSVMYRWTGGYIRNLGQIIVSPSVIEGKLTAGKTFNQTLHITSPIGRVITVHCPLVGASLRPEHVKQGENNLQYYYTPSLSGVYRCDTVEAKIKDRFSLIEGSGEIRHSSIFRVHPRVYHQALEALELLNESGLKSEGAYVTQNRGRGQEYAESREYVPGDTMDDFDWKATARMAKPFVKQFFVEGGSGIEIIYDPKAPDPVSLDELNAAFLELVMSAVRVEAPVKLALMDDVSETQVVGSQMVLEAALRIALEGQVEEFREYYRLLEPAKTRYYDWKLDALTRKKVKKASFGQDDFTPVIISPLSRDQAHLLSIRRDLARASVIQPTRPWIWESDLEASMRIYLDNRRKMRVFEKMRVKAYYSVKDFISEYRRTRFVELISG